MKKWTESQIVELFREVENCKRNNISIKVAFENIAKKYCKKANSVRNFYYQEVDLLKQNLDKAKERGIDLSRHTKSRFVGFDEEGEKRLVEEIEKITQTGASVRTACERLSNGDLSLMTRIQNKYQNIKRKSKPKVDNVVVFKAKQQSLTENDINSLFMGLVRLIKKTAIEEFSEKTKLEKQSSSFLLKKAFVDLTRKDKQIKQLREDFEALKEENKKLLELFDADKNLKTEALKLKLRKNKFENLLEK